MVLQHGSNTLSQKTRFYSSVALALVVVSCGKSENSRLQNPSVESQTPQKNAPQVSNDSIFKAKIENASAPVLQEFIPQAVSNQASDSFLSSPVETFSGDTNAIAAVGSAGFEMLAAKGAVIKTSKNEFKEEKNKSKDLKEVTIAFSKRYLSQRFLFGGVITKVTDKESEDIGGLKLSSVSPTHVEFVLNANPYGEAVSLDLFGCVENCTEGSERTLVKSIPVKGTSKSGNTLYLNMSALGQGLNVLKDIDSSGEAFGYVSLESAISETDFSQGTLVFDSVNKMAVKKTCSKDSSISPEASFTTLNKGICNPVYSPKDTAFEMTTRWYLKPESELDTSFQTRLPTEGVGFFGTARNKKEKITRFSSTVKANGEKPIYYFMKNIPEAYKPAFEKAMQAWKLGLNNSTGQDILAWEYVYNGDGKADLLNTGDVRYNIVEWDLNNAAGYGGLGPSEASQTTGETFSANTLVQGPKIEEIYKAWFENASPEKKDAKKPFSNKLKLALNQKPKVKFTLKDSDTASKIQFKIHSYDPRLADPVAANKDDFYNTPKGFTYAEYMDGYFQDLVAHEVGHNLGLRHNFKGNHGSTASDPSRSVMEYLNRQFRHLSRINEYDYMAIDYAYAGKKPKNKNWFCTDEDGYSPEINPLTGKINSAECSSSDATTNPFGYFEGVLEKVVNEALAPNSSEAPEWEMKNLQGELSRSLVGLSSYAVSAKDNAASWTLWGEKSSRPSEPEEIKAYVVNKIEKLVCNKELFEKAFASKASLAAQDKLKQNISELTKLSAEILKAQGLAKEFNSLKNCSL
jgi:Met-zincin